MPALLQPVEHVNITPNLPEIPINITPQLMENVLQGNKDSGSDSEAKVWSFDRAINEVLRLLPLRIMTKNYPGKDSHLATVGDRTSNGISCYSIIGSSPI